MLRDAVAKLRNAKELLVNAAPDALERVSAFLSDVSSALSVGCEKLITQDPKSCKMEDQEAGIAELEQFRTEIAPVIRLQPATIAATRKQHSDLDPRTQYVLAKTLEHCTDLLLSRLKNLDLTPPEPEQETEEVQDLANAPSSMPGKARKTRKK